ncbi:hypothetical protein ABW21_db0204542 [Orbilia brochopaga]|nr:hypothetical protein ABW21_db0204542 [Drechslerella brochopaga]
MNRVARGVLRFEARGRGGRWNGVKRSGCSITSKQPSWRPPMPLYHHTFHHPPLARSRYQVWPPLPYPSLAAITPAGFTAFVTPAAGPEEACLAPRALLRPRAWVYENVGWGRPPAHLPDRSLHRRMETPSLVSV